MKGLAKYLSSYVAESVGKHQGNILQIYTYAYIEISLNTLRN